MIDPIVDEVRRSREAIAARFGHDLQALFQFLKAQEEKSGREYHNFQTTAEPQGSPPVAPSSKESPVAS